MRDKTWRFEPFSAVEWDPRLHGHALQWHVRTAFRREQHNTSPYKVRAFLTFWYKVLELLDTDHPKAKVVARYEGLLRRQKERKAMEELYDRELKWIQRMKKRPYLTGAFMRPTLYNKPLPRMRNQPIHITMMIKHRILARIRRIERQQKATEWLEDIRAERELEQRLLEEGMEGSAEYASKEYEAKLHSTLASIRAGHARDSARARSAYTPEMLKTIKAARLFKIENKTREREREGRGEMTKRVIQRMRQGPPAHILAKMSKEEKRLDRIAREVSWGGYSGKVKRRMRENDRRASTGLGPLAKDEEAEDCEPDLGASAQHPSKKEVVSSIGRAEGVQTLMGHRNLDGERTVQPPE